MITIYAEKPDVGNKIAAALDCITLHDGTKVDFDHLKAKEKAVKSQQFKDGYLQINWMGEQCYVTWGYGHLCELKQAVDYNLDYKNWRNLPIPFIPDAYQVKVKDGTKKQFNLVKGLLKKSRLVINATDYDREGELIFYYLIKAAGYTGLFKRAHFTSQTKDGIREGFDHLKSEADVKPMTDAGRARSIADMDIGANLTAVMTLKNPGSGVLSVGRVQTPTLAMLVDRELEIQNFKPEPYFTITAVFETNRKEKFKAAHQIKAFKDEKAAKEIFDKINGKRGIVSDIKEEILTRPVPNLYNLSSLQMEANSRYGFTVAKTLQIAQELYEAGLTTYPRTDSQFLTSDMRPVITRTLDALEKNPIYTAYIKGRSRTYESRFFDDSKVSSHFAIIPTGQMPKALSDDQLKIYDLVARSVIALLYHSAKVCKTHVLVDVEKEPFVATGTVVKSPEWMTVIGMPKEELLPPLSVGDLLSGDYALNKKMTDPPKRYTDKTLIAAMIAAGKKLDDENLKKVMESGVKGIGTEATRAAIIETLIKREYAVREKKTIKATEKGISLIQALPLPEIKSAELTARWEERLNKIAEGKESFDVFVRDIEKLTKDWCEKLNTAGAVESSIKPTKETGYVCPVCGSRLQKYSWGYGCSNYKNGCKFSLGNTIAGKKLTDSQIDRLQKGKQTSKLKGFKSKAGKSFEAALEIKDGKLSFVFSK